MEYNEKKRSQFRFNKIIDLHFSVYLLKFTLSEYVGSSQ